MKVDNVHSGQSFGMAIKIFDPHSAEALKRSLQAKGCSAKFDKLVRSQKDNEFNIGLRYVYVMDKAKLRGCIYNGRSFYKEFREEDFSAKSLSPIKFIKKMCEEANKLRQEENAKITASKLLYCYA